MTLKAKVNDPHFQYQPRISQDVSNLVILAQIRDELSRGQAEFPGIGILCQNDQNDIEGQSDWPPFSIPAEGIPGCMFGANLVTPAQICEDLSRWQSKVDGRTDASNDNTLSAWKAKGVKAKGVKTTAT